MNEPLVSIIVPVYNSERTIRKCIESLLNIDYPNFDILIVDDGSTDKTKGILFAYKDRINLIESQHCGPSKCRNIASKQAKGDFIAFTDSDCLVDKNWLNELIRGFISDEVVGVGGIQLSPTDECNFGKIVQAFFELTGFLGGYIKSKKNKELTQAQHNASCNVIYRKEVFLEIGGFDENLWPSEDVDLDYRLKKKGFRFMYNSKAIVYHYRPQSLNALIKMMHRYGVMQGILTKRYGFFRKIQLIPIFLVIFIFLSFLSHYWLILLLFFYLIILFKLKNFMMGNLVAFLSLLSLLSWMLGFIKGLIKFNK